MNFFQKHSYKRFVFINIQKQVQIPSSFKANPNQKQGFEYRLYISDGNEIISFWHDINLKNIDKTYKMVVEIPRNERAKMEMAKNEVDNPMRFDYVNRDGQNMLRYFGTDPIFNTGFFPQTWENPKVQQFDDYFGDDDPLDVLEIGKNPLKIGEVVDVYVLGSFCVLDNNEADWKVVVINRFEAEKEFLNYTEKYYEEFKLRYVYDIMNWFKIYKTFEGSREEKKIFKEKFLNAKETVNIISNSHKDYVKLKEKKLEGFNIDYSKYNFDI